MLKASSNWCCFSVLCSLLSGNSCFTEHKTLWNLNHVYGSRKRPSVYYTWNKHLKGELGKHNVFIISVCSLCLERSQICFCCRLARWCSRLPSNAITDAFCCPCQAKWMLVHSCARRSGCWCTPVPQQATGDGASPDSQSDPSHPFSHACKTGSRAFLASSEWLAALSNVLSCLCLKLVLGQEYLSAGLAALPVFRLSLVIPGYMCLSKGGSY